MKRVVIIFAILLSIAFVGKIGAYAEDGFDLGDIDNWTNLPGYSYMGYEQQAEHFPAEIKRVNNGINYRNNAYYKIGTPDYSGIISNEKIDITNFEIEISINSIGGDIGDDCWLLIGLMNECKGWDNNDNEYNAGVIMMFRSPSSWDYTLHVTEHAADKVASSMQKTIADMPMVDLLEEGIKVKFAKNLSNQFRFSLYEKESESYYEYPAAFTRIDNLFTDNKAHLFISASTDSMKYWDFTIRSINGVSLYDESYPAEEENEDPAGDEDGNNNNNNNNNNNGGNNDEQHKGCNSSIAFELGFLSILTLLVLTISIKKQKVFRK